MWLGPASGRRSQMRLAGSPQGTYGLPRHGVRHGSCRTSFALRNGRYRVRFRRLFLAIRLIRCGSAGVSGLARPMGASVRRRSPEANISSALSRHRATKRSHSSGCGELFRSHEAGSRPCGTEVSLESPNREYFVSRLSTRRAGRYDAATSSYTAKVPAITTRSSNFANAFALAA